MSFKQRIIKAVTLISTISIIGFLTFYCVNSIHNTEDPHYAKKIALITITLILLSIMMYCFVVYYIKGENRE
jgi:uncharacterized membrane protein